MEVPVANQTNLWLAEPLTSITSTLADRAQLPLSSFFEIQITEPTYPLALQHDPPLKAMGHSMLLLTSESFVQSIKNSSYKSVCTPIAKIVFFVKNA